MALTHRIGEVEIPAGMTWTDEFDWTPVSKAVDYSLTGAMIVQASTRKAGRPITLAATDDRGWRGMTRTKLASLYAMAEAPTATYALTLADGRAFTVMFAADTPIAAHPIYNHDNPPADWPYVVTLKLQVI